MAVKVLYFAGLRERRGRAEEDLPHTPGGTARDLYLALFGASPEATLPVAFTVNRAIVPGETVLADGDEIAFLPPLGGG